MTVAFSVTMEDDHSLKFSRRVRNEIYRGACLAIAGRWQIKWLRKHFTRRARQRYRHAPRTEKWKARKKREAAKSSRVKKGGRVDIVYTGLAERLFNKAHAVRAFPTRASINMHGPRYITMRPRGKNRHAIGQEITRTVSEELRDLDRVGQAELERLIKKAPRSRQKRFKPRG